MCAEVSTVLRAVAADFFFNCWYWRSLRITVFGTYQGAFTIMRKAFDWKRSNVLGSLHDLVVSTPPPPPICVCYVVFNWFNTRQFYR
jgi:hypothetical protein